MFGGILSSLFSNSTDRILSSKDIGEADVLYAGKVDTATRKKTVKQLNNDGFSVTDLSPSEIGEGLEEQTVFYRHKMFTAGMTAEEEKEVVQELKQTEEEYDVDFIQDPVAAWYHKDKNKTAEYLNDVFQGQNNVRMAETLSDEEAHRLLEEDQDIVAKPANSCCGNDVEKLDEEQSLEEYMENLEEEDYRLEEAISHEEGYKDCRAIVLGDGEDATVLEVAAREGANEFANNLANGGQYEDSGQIFDYEVDAAIEATEGLELAAFDYMKTPDGEIIGLEVNTDMGTAINEHYSEIDVNKEISNYIEARSKGEEYLLGDQKYSEHLDVEATESSSNQLENSVEATMTAQDYNPPAV